MATFDEALQQANEDMLDDLAHGRPNRYGTIEADFGPGFLRGRLTDAANEPVIFRWPAPWTADRCLDCVELFLDGEILHPHHIESFVIQARCIPCFKTHLRKAAAGLAYGFRAINFVEEVAKLGTPEAIAAAIDRRWKEWAAGEGQLGVELAEFVRASSPAPREKRVGFFDGPSSGRYIKT